MCVCVRVFRLAAPLLSRLLRPPRPVSLSEQSPWNVSTFYPPLFCSAPASHLQQPSRPAQPSQSWAHWALPLLPVTQHTHTKGQNKQIARATKKERKKKRDMKQANWRSITHTETLQKSQIQLKKSFEQLWKALWCLGKVSTYTHTYTCTQAHTHTPFISSKNTACLLFFLPWRSKNCSNVPNKDSRGSKRPACGWESCCIHHVRPEILLFWFCLGNQSQSSKCEWELLHALFTSRRSLQELLDKLCSSGMLQSCLCSSDLPSQCKSEKREK